MFDYMLTKVSLTALYLNLFPFLKKCLYDTESISIRNEKQTFVPCFQENVSERNRILKQSLTATEHLKTKEKKD